jgi:hypothetical protein
MTNDVYLSEDLTQLVLDNDVGIEFMTFVKRSKEHKSSFGAFPPMHYSLASKLGSKDKNIVISVFRGGSKSFLVEMWALFIVYKKGVLPNFERTIQFLMYFSSSDDLCEQYIGNLNEHVADSPFLSQFIEFDSKENLKGKTVVRNKSDEYNSKGYKNPKAKRYKLTIDTAGIMSKFRGKRKGDNRPDVVIVDDILSDDMANSDLLLQKVKDVFTKGILPMGSDYTQFIFIGTPISPNDLLNELLNNPAWVTHRYPVCEKFPVSKEEFRGNWESRPKFNYEGVKAMYELAKNSSSGLSGFYQEMMLETIDLSSLLITPDLIQRKKVQHIREDFTHYNIYITTDFATSEKKSADFSVIGVWAVSYDGSWTLIDGIAKKQTMTANWNYLFKFVQKYTKQGYTMVTPEVGIEVSAQQKSFIDWVFREMDVRNIRFRLAVDRNRNSINKNGSFNYGIAPIGDKIERFVKTVYPMFTGKKVWIGIPEQHDIDFKELVKELVDNELNKLTLKSGKKGLKHDDALDMVSQMGMIELSYPNMPEMSLVEEKSSDVYGFNFADSLNSYDQVSDSTYF